MADAINWAGKVTEDEFNEKLAACSSEAERNNLIMTTLAETYEGAAAAFYENNKALVQNRRIQIAQQKITGEIGEASASAKAKMWELLGVTTDGSVATGSALDMLLQKVKEFRAWIENIDVSKYAPMVSEMVQKIVSGISTAWGMIQPILSLAVKHADTLIPAILGVVGAISSISIIADIVTKVISFINAAKQVVSVLKLAGSAVTAMLGPVGIAITVIGLLITVFVTLYKKSETFRNFVNKLGAGIKNFALTIRDAFVQMRDEIVGVFDKIKDKIKKAVEKIREFLQPMIDLIGKIKSGLQNLGFGSKTDTTQTSLATMGGKATGTPYFRGGLTRVNEGGRGEIMNLPNGTQIIPHDVAKKQQKTNNVQVQVTIQGNVIGNRAFMEQTGAYIANKILIAQGVV